MSSTSTDQSSPTANTSPTAAIASIEQTIAELEARLADAKRAREQTATQKSQEWESDIDNLCKKWSIANRQILIRRIRSGGIASPTAAKGKRLTEETLDLMRKALKNGAPATQVAKHFQVSLATVNLRKKQWKLVGRKNVVHKPVHEAIRG